MAGNDLIQKLKGLQSNSRLRRWQSIRQALKTVWKKDEINALAERLRGYERLVAQHRLKSLETKLDASCERNAQQVEVFQATSQTLLQRFANVEGTVQELRSDDAILGRFDTLHEILLNIRNTIEQPGTRPEAKHDQSISTVQQAETQMIDSPTKPDSHASTPTEGQFELMLGMIQRLQEQIAIQSEKMDTILVNGDRGRPFKKAEANKATEGSASKDAADMPAESKDLAIHIESLSRFASGKGTVMLSQDAELIIKSLDKILEAFVEADKVRTEIEQCHKRKRSDSPDVDDLVNHTQIERDIKRTRGMLATVQHFGINNPSMYPSNGGSVNATNKCPRPTLKTDTVWKALQSSDGLFLC